MKAVPTRIPDVLVIEPKVFDDERGFFAETFNRETFQTLPGVCVDFVQDNHSRSTRGVLRGLHYQIQQPQGKLVGCTCGAIFDVAVDIRKSSPTFGKWVGTELSDANHRQVWIPPGFAHGFVVLSDTADVQYKVTDYWAPSFERAIRWNDPDLRIDWPLDGEPILSARDAAACLLTEAEVFC